MVTGRPMLQLAQRATAALRRDVDGWLAAVGAMLPARSKLTTYRVHPPGGSRRIHLRTDRDGSGVLLVDVTDAIHLNASAALLARLALEGVAKDRAMAVLRGRFRRVDVAALADQTRRIYDLVAHLTSTADACPTCGLHELPRTEPFATPVAAPYKADLALTYGCNNACRHCYNPSGRETLESFDAAGWRRVLKRLARIGVPHVIFTGGEPTLVDFLPELIRYADRLGLVTGVNTNGRRLARPGMADKLKQAGLDHVQVTLESHRAEVHNAMTAADSFAETVEGIRHALSAGLHTITNTTLTRQNVDDAVTTVDFLSELGLRTFAVNGMIFSGRGCTTDEAIGEEELVPVLAAVRDRARERGMRLLWYTPTAWCRLSPVELELGPRRCNAGEYSICVEPNGDVLPCQSYYVPAGNILRDRWEQIWQSGLFRSFRDRTADPRGCGLPEPCWGCPELASCGGGCRLEREKRQADPGLQTASGSLLPTLD